MEIILLGTSSMIPTEERNHSAALLRYKNETVLIDCGEGTQRQFRKAQISAMKVTKILLTHWHGDHVLGLPGLLLTLGSQGYSSVLEIYGPKGTKDSFQKLVELFVPKESVRCRVIEVESGVFFENEDFLLEAIGVQHSIPCLAYRFIEKDRRRIDMGALKKIGVKEGPLLKGLQQGKDIVVQGKRLLAKKYSKLIKGKQVSFVSDTRFCPEAIQIARGADILFCESTYLGDMADLARERGHMTAKEAAEIAKKAQVQRLVLIHFSQRYKDLSLFEKEARKVFKVSVIGKDFSRFTL